MADRHALKARMAPVPKTTLAPLKNQRKNAPLDSHGRAQCAKWIIVNMGDAARM
ncbi:hypothetical protein PSA5_03610 [Pseudomonas syringae pv. actinidiae]|nr:hypothetical protein PSA5_03610 [Pseudomonas syringae pv. actinidiae]